ncbi:MAG: hypothetical protein PHF86_06775 [Candidatus Nanoarchaeia archaeon]|jgi:hypothetical protein|nr:hypothetical protein [Candidatus Nanoarchaeia archaeon]
MDVILTDPISITVSSAKLVIEDSSRGTIEFTVLDQPVRLNIESTSYVYDIEIVIGDRVRLTEPFSAFAENSNGIVKEIIPDRTEDKAKVWFDRIYPNQSVENVEAHIDTTVVSIMAEVPIRILEKMVI